MRPPDPCAGSAALSFVVPGPPVSTNRLWRYDRGRVHLSREAREFKVRVAAAALQAGARPLAGRVALTVVYAHRPGRRRLDLDNALKALLDALAGLCFDDDAQITRLSAEAVADPRGPRILVTVAPLDPAPLRLLDLNPPSARRANR